MWTNYVQSYFIIEHYNIAIKLFPKSSIIRKIAQHKTEIKCSFINLEISLTRHYLLPTGSEEREVLGVGSILGAILPSCQDMKTVAVKLI